MTLNNRQYQLQVNGYQSFICWKYNLAASIQDSKTYQSTK